MADNLTYESILERMLNRVSSSFDKREGSLIYDAVAPASVEILNNYYLLAAALLEVFPDTATRKYLIRHCKDKGITPKPASYATVIGSFTPTNLEIPIGARFSHEDYNYAVTEKISDGLYNLKCETIGSEPNGSIGRLIPIDYIAGLQTAQITEMNIPGEDEESTESLRARYFESLSSESFGGNKADYRQKFLSQSGIGGLKLYTGAEWNGGGTVKAVIVDTNNNSPTDEFVDQIQTWIDPEVNAGEGEGEAAIGHFVTVVGAYNTVINIETTLSYAIGYSWERVKSNVLAVIDKYFTELNASWQNIDNIIVRIAQIESRIMDVTGIIDIQNTKINGKAENLTVDKDSIVSRGTINGY